MSTDARARTRSLDPARQARDQVRAGLPVTVCPFCGGKPGGDPFSEGPLADRKACCCGSCWRDPLAGGGDPDPSAVPQRCAECPHRRPSGEP